MKPSMDAVEAATEAWNRAEPGHMIVGISYVSTFAEVLEAAYAVDLQPYVDSCVNAAIEGAVDAVRIYFGLEPLHG
jgi:hypothetical protein